MSFSINFLNGHAKKTRAHEAWRGEEKTGECMNNYSLQKAANAPFLRIFTA